MTVPWDKLRDRPWLNILRAVVQSQGGVILQHRTRFEFPEEYSHLLPFPFTVRIEPHVVERENRFIFQN